MFRTSSHCQFSVARTKPDARVLAHIENRTLITMLQPILYSQVCHSPITVAKTFPFSQLGIEEIPQLQAIQARVKHADNKCFCWIPFPTLQNYKFNIKKLIFFLIIWHIRIVGTKLVSTRLYHSSIIHKITLK